MNLLRFIFSAALLAAPVALAQDDPGKASVVSIAATVYYATDGDPEAAGSQAAGVDEAVAKRLRSEAKLRFQHYRALGQDTQPLFRSFENWAQPLKPSDEILVRFEARSRPAADSARLDLELWLSRKKVLKTDAFVERGRPLFILGPHWRGGRLIISVDLAPK